MAPYIQIIVIWCNYKLDLVHMVKIEFDRLEIIKYNGKRCEISLILFKQFGVDSGFLSHSIALYYPQNRRTAKLGNVNVSFPILID